MQYDFNEYNLHGLLKISTNIEEIKRSLAYFACRDIREQKFGQVDILVEQKNKLEVDKTTFIRVGDFYYNAKIDELYFEQPFFYPVQLLVKGVASNDIAILVSKGFLKLPTILRGQINFTYLFKEIMLLKLIEKGYLFLHGAGVDIEGRGVVFTGFPNTGKTYLSFGLIKEGYARLLSDEYTLINANANMQGFIGMSALSPKLIKEFKIKITWKDSLIMALCKIRAGLLPFLFEPIIWIHSGCIFQDEKRLDNSQLRYLIFLERGNKGINDIDKEEAYKKLLLLTENEFPFTSNYFLQVYSYVNKNFNLANFQERAKKIICDLIENINSAFILSFTPGNINYLYSLLKERLKE